jgi:hypothetical protein
MREGGLGAVLAGDAVLLGREQLSPLLVGLVIFSGRVECIGLLLGAVTTAASFNPVRALGNTAPINQR